MNLDLQTKNIRKIKKNEINENFQKNSKSERIRRITDRGIFFSQIYTPAIKYIFMSVQLERCSEIRITFSTKEI